MTTPEIVRAIEACDYFRRSPWRTGGERGHKEWLHFCIGGDGFDLLVNLSIVDDLRPDAEPGSEIARLCVLSFDGVWRGAITRLDPARVRVSGGAIAADLGDSGIRFVDGAYLLRVRAPEAGVSADLRLSPVTFPSLVNNVRGLDGRPIHWAVVPRSAASGTVTIRDRVHRLDGAPAYHDHNWGSFSWGNNFAWEWGYGLPTSREDPFALVFARLNSRGHTVALMQLFFVWRGDRLLRTFRDHDIETRREGLLRCERPLVLPPVMALAAPGTATDVPARLLVRAAAGADAVEAVFESEHVAQVMLPNDSDLGVTVINEVAGTLTVAGTVAGERIALRNRVVFEVLSA